jgi:hypothetical protein
MSKHAVAPVDWDSGSQHKYEQLPTSEEIDYLDDPRESRSSLIPVVDEHPLESLERHLKKFKRGNRRRLIGMVMGVIGLLLILFWAVV